MPALRIGSFKVSKGWVSYEDRSRPSAFTARLEPINFELMSFTTGVDGGRFTFTGSSKLGERVEWHGHVSVQPIESDGEFQVDGLQAHTIWEYLEDRLSFAVNSGTIDLNATYKFSLKDAVELRAAISKIALTDLAVRLKDADADWVTVPSLLVSGTTVDLAKRQAHVDSLSIKGLKLLTWLEPDGSFNLLKLAQTPPTPHAHAHAHADRHGHGGSNGSGCGAGSDGQRLACGSNPALERRCTRVRDSGREHFSGGSKHRAGREGAAGAALDQGGGSKSRPHQACIREPGCPNQRSGIC